MKGLQDFLSFHKMVSTAIIKFLYLVGVIIISLGALATLLKNFLLALGIFLVGNLFWRIFCESLILLFSIQDLLVKINQKILNH
jgi:uncharacterized membrane protein